MREPAGGCRIRGVSCDYDLNGERLASDFRCEATELVTDV
jgi:hypothetical protein